MKKNMQGLEKDVKERTATMEESVEANKKESKEHVEKIGVNLKLEVKKSELRCQEQTHQLEDYIAKTVFKRIDNMSDMLQERVGYQRMSAMNEIEFPEPSSTKYNSSHPVPAFVKTKLRAKKAIQNIKEKKKM